MQQISPTDKGLKLAILFSSFTMFPVMMNPLKFGWLVIPPSLILIYFASKKYKEDKKAGIEHSKAGTIIVTSSIAVVIMTLVMVANYLIEKGYFD